MNLWIRLIVLYQVNLKNYNKEGISMKIDELVNYIIEICKKNKLNKVYICGNGGSGKTTLSRKIAEVAVSNGNVNIISMDDFMANTELRKNAKVEWEEDGIKYEGRYTSSNFETYFLKNVYEILYNIDHGVDCYYFPRRYKEKNNMRQLSSDYFLTVIEGIGTVFLEKNKEKSLTILLKCDKENEIKRREVRTKELNRKAIELYDEKRSSQYRVNVLSHESEFDLVISNDEEFNYIIEKGI